jgi:hypothetical protein
MTADQKRDLIEGFLISLFYHVILLELVFLCIAIFHSEITLSLITGLFNAWDGNTYVSLARFGYQTVGDQANYIVFYPLYPFLVGVIAKLGVHAHFAGVLTTIIGSLIGHTAFFLWLRERGLTPWQARRVFFLFLINPVTVYFTLVCTEGVFLGLTSLFFLFLYRRSYAIAALCGLFASATRLVGITLIVPFVLFFIENHLARVQWKKAFWGLLIPVGFVSFLGINYWLYQNPFHYQAILQQNWNKSVTNPVTQYIQTFRGIVSFFPTKNITYGTDIISTLIAPIFILLYIAIRRKKVWLAGTGFALANLFIITAQSYWLSNTRYISLILPLYVFIEELTRRFLLLYSIVCIVFIILSLYAITLFAQGGWLY